MTFSSSMAVYSILNLPDAASILPITVSFCSVGGGPIRPLQQ
jgi:hypothetical protein